MARLRTLRISVLNVVSHPHSEERYVQLMRAAKNKRVVAPYFGNKVGMIGAFNKYSAAAASLGQVFHGSFHLFTEIDRDQPWYNVATGEQADEEEVATIQLPNDLRPEFHPVPYVFF